MTPVRKAVLWATLPVLLLAPPLVWEVRRIAAREAQDERVRVQRILDLHAQAAELALSRMEGKLESLAVFAEGMAARRAAIDTSRFDTFAAGLHASAPWIRAFQVVSNGVIVHTYPLEGNEAVLGYNLLQDPRPPIGGDVLRAQKTGKVTITGPIALVQGGLGIIVRKPLAVRYEDPKLLVAIVLNIAPLLIESGLSESGTDDVAIAFRSEVAGTFFGRADVFGWNPVVYRITLPDGAWEIGACPAAGWPPFWSRPVALFLAGGCTIILLLSLLFFLLARRQAGLFETVRSQTRTLRMLSECNRALVRATGEGDLLHAVCRIVVEQGGYRMAWVGFAEHDGGKSVRPVAQAGFGSDYLASSQISWADSERGRGPTGTAIRSGCVSIARDIHNDPALAPWREAAIRHGYQSSIALPLKDRGEIFGAIMMYSEKRDAFDAAEVDLLEELARDLAYGIAALRTSVEHLRAEEALRESETRLRLVGDNLPDSYVYQYTYGADGTPQFLYLSAGMERVHGLKTEDVLRDARLLHAQIAPSQLPEMQAEEQASLRGMTDFAMELEMRRTDGTWRWLRVCSRPRLEAAGRVVWDGVATDITVSKQAATARQAAEQRLADIVEFLPDATFVIDEDKRVIAWNRACEVMTGVKKEALLGRGDYAYAEPFFGERHPILIDLLDLPSPELEARYKYVQRQGDRVYAESYIPRLRGGQGAHLWGVASPLFDREGRRCGAIETVRDVTDSKLTEEELRARETQLRLIHDNSYDVIFAIGVEGEDRFRFLSVNHRFTAVTGLREEQVVGKLLQEIIPEPAREMVLRNYREAIRTRQPVHWEETSDYPTGRKTGVVAVAPVFDAGGRCTQLVGTVHDITERKRAEDELRAIQASLERRVRLRTAELAAAKEGAEAADRLKSAFLATMSHELRTPLNSIIGFTGILLQGLAGPLNAEQMKQLDMVRASARHLLALINDVLDISKIEAGQLDVSRERFDPRESIDRVIGLIRPMAERKGLALRAEVDPGVRAIVSDPRRVDQVLLNLLNNAVKFTGRGGVTLAARVASGELRISVTDTGIGIRDEDLGKLFQPFRQIDSGLARQHEGTGLGLAICQRLARLLGGTMDVKSEWGKGSVFTFTLPMQEE